MKRKTAKEILAESFREVAQNKPIDKITIRDITENCGYSPATFYRQFSDKYDLIAWDYVHRTTTIMNKVGVNGYQWSDTLYDGADFWLENKEYIKNLLLHTQGHESFVRRLSRANIEHLSKCILKLTGKKELEPETEIYVRVYVYGTVQTICEWILDMIDIDINTLSELFENSLPEPLKIYLVNNTQNDINLP